MSSRDIRTLREVVTKLVPMLASRGLKVTQQGAKAFVQVDPKTHKIIRVNIPHIGDDASEDLLASIQGFIDHEVGHVLFTDWTQVNEAYRLDTELAKKRTHKRCNGHLKGLHNAFEDPFVERRMGEKFPGSRANIDRLQEKFLVMITEPALAKAHNDEERFSYLLVPVVRAWSGQVVFDEWLKKNGYWDHPLVKAVNERLSAATKARIPTLANSAETLEVAIEVYEIINPELPPPPPPPPAAPPSDEKSKDEPKPDDKPDEKESSKDKSDSATGEGDNKDKPEDENDAGEGGDVDADEDSADEGDEADDADGDAGSGGDEAQDDAGKDGESQQENEDDAGDEDQADDADDDSASAGDVPDEKPADDEEMDSGEQPGEGEGADEAPGEGSAGDDAGDAEEETSAGGSDHGDDDQQDDGDRDQDDTSGSSDDRPGAEEDRGSGQEEETDGEAGSASAEDGTDDDATGEPGVGGADEEEIHDTDGRDVEMVESEAGPGGAGPSPFIIVVVDLDEESNLNEAIAKEITDEASREIRDADYRVFTTDWDYTGPYEVSPGYRPEWLVKLDDKTTHMVAPMQRDIERMMAARSQVRRQPGFRSGRLNAGALAMLHPKINDDRVFSRKYESKSTETAVGMLCDNSGSMHGAPCFTAMAASYALSQTLERVRVRHAVWGFTTREPTSEQMAEIKKEEDRLGVSFTRYERLFMPTFKGFDERLTPDVRKRFAEMAVKQPQLKNNVDGEAVRYAWRQLAAQKERRKVLIVLSDGDPCCATTDWSAINADLHRAVKEAHQHGVECIGIGILDDAVRTFYPKHVVLHDLDDLPKTVMGELKKILVASSPVH